MAENTGPQHESDKDGGTKASGRGPVNQTPRSTVLSARGRAGRAGGPGGPGGPAPGSPACPEPSSGWEKGPEGDGLLTRAGCHPDHLRQPPSSPLEMIQSLLCLGEQKGLHPPISGWPESRLGAGGWPAGLPGPPARQLQPPEFPRTRAAQQAPPQVFGGRGPQRRAQPRQAPRRSRPAGTFQREALPRRRRRM